MTLLSDLRILAPLTSSDIGRYATDSVHIRPTAEGCLMIASDARHGAGIWSPEKIPVESSVRVARSTGGEIEHEPDASCLEGECDKCDGWSEPRNFHRFDGKLEIAADGKASIALEPRDLDPVPLEASLVSPMPEGSVVVELNPRLLADILIAASKFLGSNGFPVARMIVPPKGDDMIRIECEKDGRRFVGIIMPIVGAK